MRPRIRRQRFESTRQPTAVLGLQTMVVRRPVIGGYRQPVRYRTSRATDFTPDQVAAGRPDIADRYHALIPKCMLDSRVPLFHQGQAEIRREAKT